MRSSMLFPRIASKVKAPLGTQRYLADFVKKTDKLGAQGSVSDTIKALKEQALPGETVDVRGKIKILAKKRRDLMKNFKPRKYDENLNESAVFDMASGAAQFEKNTPEKFTPNRRSRIPEKMQEETDEENKSKLEDNESYEMKSAVDESEQKSVENLRASLIEDGDYDELARLDEKDFLHEKLADDSAESNEKNLDSLELEEELFSIEVAASTAAEETAPAIMNKLKHLKQKKTLSEEVGLHKGEKVSIHKYEDIPVPKSEDGAVPKSEDGAVPKSEDVAVPKDKAVAVPKNEEAVVRTNEEAADRKEEEAAIRKNEEAVVRTNDEAVILTNEKPAVLKNEKPAVLKNKEAAVPKNEDVVLKNENFEIPKHQEVPVRTDKKTAINKNEEVTVPKDREISSRKDKEIATLKDKKVSVVQDEDSSNKRAAINKKNVSVGKEKAVIKILKHNATHSDEGKGLLQEKTIKETQKGINPKATEQTDFQNLEMIDLTHIAKKKRMTTSDAGAKQKETDLIPEIIKDSVPKKTDKIDETKMSEQRQTGPIPQKMEGQDQKRSNRTDETKIPKPKETETILQKMETPTPKESSTTDKSNFSKQKETELLPQRMESKAKPETDNIKIVKSAKQKEKDQILKQEANAVKQKELEPKKQKDKIFYETDKVDEANLTKPIVKPETKIVDQRIQVLQPLKKPELDEPPRITDNKVSPSKEAKNKNSMESKKSKITPSKTPSEQFEELAPEHPKTYSMTIVKQRNLPSPPEDQKNEPTTETASLIPEQDLGAKFKEVHKQLEAFSKVKDSSSEQVKETLAILSPTEIQSDIMASMQKKLESFKKQVLPQITGPLSHEEIKMLTREIVSNYTAKRNANNETVQQIGGKKETEVVADPNFKNTTCEMASNQETRAAAHVTDQKPADEKCVKKLTPTSKVDNDNLTTFIADDLMEELNTSERKERKDLTRNSMTIMSTANQDYITSKTSNTPKTPENLAEPQGSAKNLNNDNLNLYKKGELKVKKQEVLPKPTSDATNVTKAPEKMEKVGKATSPANEGNVLDGYKKKDNNQSHKKGIETQQSTAESSKAPVKVEQIHKQAKESEIIGYELKAAAKSNNNEGSQKKTADIPQAPVKSSKAPEKVKQVKSNEKSKGNDMVRETDMFSKEIQTDSIKPKHRSNNQASNIQQTSSAATETPKMPRKPEQVLENNEKVNNPKKSPAAEQAIEVKDSKAKNPISEVGHMKKKDVNVNDVKKCNLCGGKMEQQSKEIPKKEAGSKVAVPSKDSQSHKVPSHVTDTNKSITRDSPPGKPSDQKRKFYKGHNRPSIKNHPMDILPQNQTPRKNVDIAPKPLELPVKVPMKPSKETEPTGMAETKTGEPPVGMPKSNESSPSIGLGKLEMTDTDTWFPIREGFMSPMRDINNQSDKPTCEINLNQESKSKLTVPKKPTDIKLDANAVVKLAVSNEKDFVDILQSIKESGPSVIAETAALQTKESQSNLRKFKENKINTAKENVQKFNEASEGEDKIGAALFQTNVTDVSKDTVLSHSDTSIQKNVKESVEENSAKMSLTTRTKKEEDVKMEAALMRTILKEAVEESLQRIGQTLEIKRENNNELEDSSMQAVEKDFTKQEKSNSNKEESFALVRKFFNPSQQSKNESVDNFKEVPRKPVETVPLTRVSLIDIITERMKAAETQKKPESMSASVDDVPKSEAEASQPGNPTATPDPVQNSNSSTVMGTVTTDSPPEEFFFDGVSKKPTTTSSEKKKLAFSRSSNKKLSIGILNPGTSKELQKPSTAPSGPTANLMQSASERDGDKTTTLKKFKSAMFNFTYDHFWSYFKPTQPYNQKPRATITISKTKPRQPIRLDGKLVISKKKE